MIDCAASHTTGRTIGGVSTGGTRGSSDMIAREERFAKRRQRPLLPLAVFAVLLMSPAPGLGQPRPEDNPPKTPTPKPPEPAREIREMPPDMTRKADSDSAPKRATRPAIEGVYSVEGSSIQVVVKHLFADYFTIHGSDAWEGVGILDGSIYRGVFRNRDRPDTPGGAMGQQTIDWSDPESPSMRATYTIRRDGQLTQRWHRVPESGKGSVEKPPAPPDKIVVTPPGRRPEFGEYVYVEELPEVVQKVPPVYPEPGSDGTVLVQALVLEDGSVGDVRVVNSIPMLDEAAVACVRQWRFKPARSAGKPVAVWVAVPVRFSRQ